MLRRMWSWVAVVALCSLCKARDTCVLIAQARMGAGLEQLAASKLEAALTLALEVTGRYSVVPVAVRDSLVQLLQHRGEPPTALAVARELGCQGVCFALAERFVHLLRVEVVFRWGPAFAEEHRGVGYALVRHVWVGSGEPLYDPALLEAAQRAIAVACGDSGLYSKHEPPLRVFPAAVLAVSGLAYVDAPDMPRWQLFAREVVTSYEAVLEAIDTARHHPHYVVCDIDTRDSIYARAGFFEPENYNPPTPQELSLLAQMGVEYVLTGRFLRVPEGARLSLELYRLRWVGGSLVPEYLRSVEGSVVEDSSRALRRTVRQLVGELLWGNP